ncbi:MAG TPA: hypothetical protein VHH36_06070 [Candidatus Thermoplasmatota archaeon]|nr:hypothetical protein [Candidatus Thermoplasmatota archaeon]
MRTLAILVVLLAAPLAAPTAVATHETSCRYVGGGDASLALRDLSVGVAGCSFDPRGAREIEIVLQDDSGRPIVGEVCEFRDPRGSCHPFGTVVFCGHATISVTSAEPIHVRLPGPTRRADGCPLANAPTTGTIVVRFFT